VGGSEGPAGRAGAEQSGPAGCPSEHLALKWGDINWAEDRMTVHAPKTEHHEGKESRLVPIFPEVRGPLLEVFEQAAEG
jgi:integrase